MRARVVLGTLIFLAATPALALEPDKLVLVGPVGATADADKVLPVVESLLIARGYRVVRADGATETAPEDLRKQMDAFGVVVVKISYLLDRRPRARGPDASPSIGISATLLGPGGKTLWRNGLSLIAEEAGGDPPPTDLAALVPIACERLFANFPRLKGPAAPVVAVAGGGPPPMGAMACALIFPPGTVEVKAGDIRPELIDRRPGGAGGAVQPLKAISVRFDSGSAVVAADKDAVAVLAKCAATAGLDLSARAMAPANPTGLMETAQRTAEVVRLATTDKLPADRVSVEIITRPDREPAIDLLLALLPARGAKRGPEVAQGRPVVVTAPPVKPSAPKSATPVEPPATAELEDRLEAKLLDRLEAKLEERLRAKYGLDDRVAPASGSAKPSKAETKAEKLARQKAEREEKARLDREAREDRLKAERDAAEERRWAAKMEREAREDRARAEREARAAHEARAREEANAEAEARAAKEREKKALWARQEQAEREARGDPEVKTPGPEVGSEPKAVDSQAEAAKARADALSAAGEEARARAEAKIAEAKAKGDAKAEREARAEQARLEAKAAREAKAEEAARAKAEGQAAAAEEARARAEARLAEAKAKGDAKAEREAQAEQARLEAKAAREAKAAEEAKAKAEAKAEREARAEAEAKARAEAKAEQEAKAAAEAKARADAKADREVKMLMEKAAALDTREDAVRAASTRLEEIEQAASKREAELAERAAAIAEKQKKLAADEQRLAGSAGKLVAIGPVEKEFAETERLKLAEERRHQAAIVAARAAEQKLKGDELAQASRAEKLRNAEAEKEDQKDIIEAKAERLKVEEAAARAREQKLAASRERLAAQEQQLEATEQRLAALSKRLEAVGDQQEQLRSGEGGRKQIEQAIEKNRGDIIRCVESQLKRNPQAMRAEGVLRLTIDGRGRVPRAAITEGKLKGTFLEGCVKEAARAWRFPMSGDEYDLQVPITVVGREGG